MSLEATPALEPRFIGGLNNSTRLGEKWQILPSSVALWLFDFSIEITR